MCDPVSPPPEPEPPILHDAALESFLKLHPSLCVLPPGKKVRCTLTGHELPCRLPVLQAYTSGKKYLRLSQVPDVLDFTEYEPHIVPSTKNPHQLFCKLTLRHINRIPEHVVRHVEGRRYQKALKRYEACQKAGVPYVPTCLVQKRRQWRQQQQQEENQAEGSRPPRRRKGEFWEPPGSDEDENKTDDSLSDLYPPELFPEKNPAGEERGCELNTDSEEEEEEEEEETPLQKGSCENGNGSEAMEVDPQRGCKRGQKQGGGQKKKFKSRNRKPRRFGKAANGM